MADQQTYVPAAGDVVIPGATGVTELFSWVLGGINGCGEAALIAILVLMGKAKGTPAEVTAFIWQVIKNGFSSNGAINPAAVIWLAKQNGVELDSTDWNNALDTLAGSVPIEVEVKNASALGGTDSTVHIHYITVLGKTASGLFVVSDPNSNQSKTGKLVVYSKQQISAALPIWAGIPKGFIGGSDGNLFGDIAAAIKAFPQTLVNDVEGAIALIPSAVDKFFTDIFGVENTKDLAYRAAFIVSGIVLIGIGTIIITEVAKIEATKHVINIAENTAQSAAPVAQGAATVAAAG